MYMLKISFCLCLFILDLPLFLSISMYVFYRLQKHIYHMLSTRTNPFHSVSSEEGKSGVQVIHTWEKKKKKKNYFGSLSTLVEKHSSKKAKMIQNLDAGSKTF